MEIYAIKVNGFERPMGCLLGEIILSWKVRHAGGTRQQQVKIQVSPDAGFDSILCCKQGRLNSLAEKIELPLQPRTRYYVRITVEDNSGDRAAGETWFETGKLQEPWIGKWIGTDPEDRFHPRFWKAFSLRASIEAARLYISGLGLFEAELNGKKVGNDFLAPFVNDYETAVQSCTYDVTELLQDYNTLSVCLGNGWYKGRLGYEGQQPDPSKEFLLIAELHICYANGETEIIATDERWQYEKSHFISTDLYDGEVQDYTAPHGIAKQAVPKAPGIALCERYSLPLSCIDRLEVKEILQTPAGECLLDFGQNFAGLVAFDLPMEKGETVMLEFAEILQNGNFYNENYRTAKSLFTYCSDGENRTVHAHFTFYGFRYVKVTGISRERVEKGQWSGMALCSQMDSTGAFHCSDEKINRLYANTLWGMRSNFLDIPTDCPQRDERLAWTGDAQVFAPTACYHMDTRAFYGKFLRDLHLDQKRHDGAVAIYIPRLIELSANVWGDAATFLPMALYRHYGDKYALRNHYPMMRDWVEHLRRISRDDLIQDSFQFGDWLALDGDNPFTGKTDATYIASAYYCQSAKLTAQAARILGKPEEAWEFENLSEAIRTAILSRYFEGSQLKIDTQTAYLVALRFDLCPDREELIRNLRDRLERDGCKITGGFVGAPTMPLVLAQNGMGEEAYQLLFRQDYPGWLYAVNMGATTVWERWNSVLPDGSMNPEGMNSLNHYAFGSVAEFLYRIVGGITELEPGFRKIRIAPILTEKMDFEDCSLDSACGIIVSNWRRNGRGAHFHMEIPFDTSAEIHLPDGRVELVTAGIYDFEIPNLEVPK